MALKLFWEFVHHCSGPWTNENLVSGPFGFLIEYPCSMGWCAKATEVVYIQGTQGFIQVVGQTFQNPITFIVRLISCF